MKQRDARIFNIAKALAVTSAHAKARIGAVVVSGRDIVSVGVNGRKSHPLQRHYNALRFEDHRAAHLMHAELEAIIRGRAYLRGDNSIYVYRELKTGVVGMSRPCVGCMRALRDHNINNIFYTTDQGFAYEELDS